MKKSFALWIGLLAASSATQFAPFASAQMGHPLAPIQSDAPAHNSCSADPCGDAKFDMCKIGPQAILKRYELLKSGSCPNQPKPSQPATTPKVESSAVAISATLLSSAPVAQIQQSELASAVPILEKSPILWQDNNSCPNGFRPAIDDNGKQITKKIKGKKVFKCRDKSMDDDGQDANQGTDLPTAPQQCNNQDKPKPVAAPKKASWDYVCIYTLSGYNCDNERWSNKKDRGEGLRQGPADQEPRLSTNAQF